MKPEIVDIEPDTTGVGPSDTGGLTIEVIASDGHGFRAILDESTSRRTSRCGAPP